MTKKSAREKLDALSRDLNVLAKQVSKNKLVNMKSADTNGDRLSVPLVHVGKIVALSMTIGLLIFLVGYYRGYYSGRKNTKNAMLQAELP